RLLLSGPGDSGEVAEMSAPGDPWSPGAGTLSGQWHRPGGIDVAQWLAMNRTPIPLPSHTRSAGWLPKAELPAIVSKFGLLPWVSAWALATTMPPELICAPLLPVTLLCVTTVWVAPSSKMPPPWRFTGVSPCLGQNLLLRDTLL